MLNLTLDPNCFNFCVESDERCVRFSERSLTKKPKEAQRFSRSSRKKEDRKRRPQSRRTTMEQE